MNFWHGFALGAAAASATYAILVALLRAYFRRNK